MEKKKEYDIYLFIYTYKNKNEKRIESK